MRVIRRAAVVGSPVGHSLSPVIHRAAYAQLGLDWTYERIELKADEFAPFVDTLDASWRGLSVTMPLKEAAARCGRPDDDVVLTGVANTVVVGGQRTVHNTDIAGAADALASGSLTGVRTATVIGNGATARSVVVALARSGTEVVEVQGRDPGRLAEFRRWASGALQIEVQPRTLGCPLDPATELLVGTTPAVALTGRLDTLQVDRCPALRGVFDVIYDPWPTPLAQRAAAAGVPLVGGLDLLVHQAVHQVRLMTGHEVAAEVLMSAVRAEVARLDAS